MEMKWTIERKPGAFASDPCYYEVKLNGNHVINVSKKKTAEKFIETFGKTFEQAITAIGKAIILQKKLK